MNTRLAARIVHSPEKPSIALLVVDYSEQGWWRLAYRRVVHRAKIGAKETSIREANDQRASLLSKLAETQHNLQKPHTMKPMR